MAAPAYSDYISCDLQDVARRLARHNPRAAELFLQAVRADAEFLAEYPGAGPIRREFAPSGVRFWPVTGFDRYVILYRVQAEQVEIWRVVHGARDFRKLAAEEP